MADFLLGGQIDPAKHERTATLTTVPSGDFTTHGVIVGMTGSGKTKILQQLAKAGEQVIDLEELARHQGSSYGSMNKLVQPTQEQFENNLAKQLSVHDRHKKIWLEDESSSIGKCLVPRPLWKQMRDAPVLNMIVPFEQRVEHLVAEYGCLDKTFLIECSERIWKRLGPEQTQQVIAAIQEDRMSDFVKLVLHYYDKTYTSGLQKRRPGTVIPAELHHTETAENALQILEIINAHEQQRH